MKQVVIVGGGFAGLNAAKTLGGRQGIQVVLIDRRNHHLFQPLLYQVAMAGLSPAEIAAPIRSLVSGYQNIQVLQEEVTRVDLDRRLVAADGRRHGYDYLLLACGVRHTYFGHPEWERHAPGLKTIEEATEIRRRVLQAFEDAEMESSRESRERLLTFVVVGGGPTGVELAGAIGEMSRFTLARDFRNVDPTSTRVILIEAGPRILGIFAPSLAKRAAQDLSKLGVQVRTSTRVTKIDGDGVEVDGGRITAGTVLWAAGVESASLGRTLGAELDGQGRVVVGPDLSLPLHPEVFVSGDMAHVQTPDGKTLPGMAPVALQQGRFVGRAILRDLAGQPREAFQYRDKGQMATIGRSRAVVESGRFRMGGFVAWLAWLLVHIYYLTGFQNRVLVVMRWAWAYLTFRRGARLILKSGWKSPDAIGGEKV